MQSFYVLSGLLQRFSPSVAYLLPASQIVLARTFDVKTGLLVIFDNFTLVAVITAAISYTVMAIVRNDSSFRFSYVLKRLRNRRWGRVSASQPVTDTAYQASGHTAEEKRTYAYTTAFAILLFAGFFVLGVWFKEESGSVAAPWQTLQAVLYILIVVTLVYQTSILHFSRVLSDQQETTHKNRFHRIICLLVRYNAIGDSSRIEFMRQQSDLCQDDLGDNDPGNPKSPPRRNIITTVRANDGEYEVISDYDARYLISVKRCPDFQLKKEDKPRSGKEQHACVGERRGCGSDSGKG